MMLAKTRNNPTVSVIIPTYNRAHLVGRAIQSVLNQTYQNFEVIVIDDGSTDDAEEVLKSFKDERVRYIRLRENSGGSAVPRNTGLNAARGEYIAVLDDDDFWLDEDRLKKQVKFLNTHPDHVVVGTNAIAVDESGTELSRSFRPESDDEIRNKILQQNCIIHSTAVFRKLAAMKFGGYTEKGNVKTGRVLSWEWDLWLKLGTVGKLANLPIYGAKISMQPGGITAQSGIVSRLMDIQLVGKYKNEYPNYWRAISFQSVGVFNTIFYVISDLPPFLGLKELLKSRCPACWRAIKFSHKIIQQGILQSILGILYLFNRLHNRRLNR